MNEPTLHPNLAKLAAAYDQILERMSRGQISTVAARSEIAQLEARDDQGVRWNIDPDTGEWVRKTALGDYEYDNAPPTYGYMTPDAFDYTANPTAFNPADRIQVTPVSEPAENGPFSLAGATRTQPTSSPGRAGTGGWSGKVAALLGPQAGSKLGPLVARAAAAPIRTKAVAVAAVAVLLALVLYSCSGGSATTPGPTSPRPATAAHPMKPATKAHHGRSVRPVRR